MHEVAIVQALLAEVTAAASRHGLKSVSAVGVCVGQHSGVAAEALIQVFEVLREGCACGAVLSLKNTEGADLRMEWLEGE